MILELCLRVTGGYLVDDFRRSIQLRVRLYDPSLEHLFYKLQYLNHCKQ